MKLIKNISSASSMSSGKLIKKLRMVLDQLVSTLLPFECRGDPYEYIFRLSTTMERIQPTPAVVVVVVAVGEGKKGLSSIRFGSCSLTWHICPSVVTKIMRNIRLLCGIPAIDYKTNSPRPATSIMPPTRCKLPVTRTDKGLVD